MEEQDLPVQKKGGGEERSVGEVKRKRIEEVKAPVKAGESSKDGSSCAAPVPAGEISCVAAPAERSATLSKSLRPNSPILR